MTEKTPPTRDQLLERMYSYIRAAQTAHRTGKRSKANRIRQRIKQLMQQIAHRTD